MSHYISTPRIFYISWLETKDRTVLLGPAKLCVSVASNSELPDRNVRLDVGQDNKEWRTRLAAEDQDII